MKVAQIYLEKACTKGAERFQAIVEGLDRYAISQHVLVASPALEQRLRGLPYVTVGPLVSAPVMAYCLVPEVDVVHVHDTKSAQTGLLLTLTRSLPYVLTTTATSRPTRNPLTASIRDRARILVAPDELQAASLVEAYRSAVKKLPKGPENTNGG